MRRVAVGLLAAALCMTTPAVVAADPTYTCPDGMMWVPVSLVQNGQAKDKNGNGIVCGKYKDGGFTGGPDDRAESDDILV